MSKVYENLENAEEIKAPLIYQKIIDVMNDCPAIAKDSKNQQQGFKYRGVDAVMNVLNPLFRKHGVFAVPYVTYNNREDRTTKSGGNLIYTSLGVEYRFYAADGSCVTACVQGEGMDSADKSSNKAMAVAFKYACFQVLCIPTEEFVDPDADSHEDSTPATKPTTIQTVSAPKPTSPPIPTEPPAPIEHEAPPETVKCVLCGEIIEPKMSKGVYRTAKEIAEATGGKCSGCYKLTKSSAGVLNHD